MEFQRRFGLQMHLFEPSPTYFKSLQRPSKRAQDAFPPPPLPGLVELRFLVCGAFFLLLFFSFFFLPVFCCCFFPVWWSCGFWFVELVELRPKSFLASFQSWKRVVFQNPVTVHFIWLAFRDGLFCHKSTSKQAEVCNHQPVMIVGKNRISKSTSSEMPHACVSPTKTETFGSYPIAPPPQNKNKKQTKKQKTRTN